MPVTSISERGLMRYLAYLITKRGKPRMMVSDYDPEFAPNAMLAWCREVGMGPGLGSKPNQPLENHFVH